MQSVYIRLALYVASTLLGLIPGAALGWVSYDAATHILTVNVEGALTALGTGLIGSVGVFAKWGIR
ncbi:hypothetical protein [Pseudodonghicola flavimaris]|uniref:Uncharacterized protein n=1 Tax=Pseudodonghicola flavimaris TaxID=3050036 RepID=A0ABT7F823_9RHOB|nr:hypothetical protein [Pseudodonghicola flavimaris]MDK3020767.1 hypothetical protein [Pseudodonghicola flavimaris]